MRHGATGRYVYLKVPQDPERSGNDATPFINDNYNSTINSRKSKEVKLEGTVKTGRAVKAKKTEIEWINVKKFNT